MPDREKILLDTDIGSDIDDCSALAYLLSQPRCELVGITTVAGEPLLRAEMASAICRHVGRDEIPIHPGASVAMIEPYRPYKGKAPQAAALGDWPRRREFEAGSAIEFMRQTIRRHPGEITLLAIGPFTNIGLLFATDPEIPTLIKQLVVMGGAFFGSAYAESNIRNDAYAAAIVYGQGPQPRPARHTSFGLDVTLKCKMMADECRRRFTAKVLEPVRDFAEVWFAHRPVSHFHDPLAAACIFEPELCQYRTGRVRVALTEPALGWTIFDAPTLAETDPPHPHRIADAVDAERFFEHYFDIVK